MITARSRITSHSRSEQALCLLHREAWPERNAAERNFELKRRFEDRLLNAEMSQHLRLHARDCDFAATVLKARQFVDAAESTRPKKTVRILKQPTAAAEVDDDTAYFQPFTEAI